MRKQNDPKPNKKRFKKTNNNQEQGLRIPRPLGLTLLAQQTRKEPTSDSNIQQILSYILKANLQVNGNKLNISTLAKYLNISVHRVMKAYIAYQGKLSRVMLGNKEDLKGALIFSSFENFLEDKALIMNQLRTLQASQGNEYKAYISSSVNEALNLNMQASKNILSLFQAINNNGPNIAIQNNLTQHNSAIKAIGTNEAIKILTEQGLNKITYNPSDYTHLIAQNGLEGLPETRAHHMKAVASDGLSLANKPKAEILDERSHIDRRADEEDADIEELI